MSQENNIAETLRKKVILDLSAINDPVEEYVRLNEVGNEDVLLKTKSKSFFILKKDDIAKLKENLPSYFHEMLALPIEINILVTPNNKIYMLNEDLWQRRAVRYILNKKLEYEPKKYITNDELNTLISLMPSVFKLKIKVEW
ncbi:DUF61 family protein [Fervidicoccus fontis]|uniref:DUF61 family protein n=2 Tax=Fervidicoccus fontis TaxID=683846 RepID=I0A2K0_FERFK|nr:DUF61 family protein [Fervidicoccus fontis]AFH43207.1 hypothetical protein FFONT_1219 [Fervidicoccus fontis Kam940]MBE9390587.1 DUF61 family protein [Fervidicoccus fontis]PMB75921.1 MAG: DUF61 domain-containing protein [Fervidicoccus fontis]PMB77410.1 MAG: DUF61 domain-containing protein [Fervidicoccus fontis]HEW63900.1 DUF61 family protein [Fervidicoccus fontis]